MYDVSWFQKCNFYLILITSKFYLKSFLPPSSFSVKSGCNRIGLKSTFLEPENIIYHCLVLGFPDSFHGIPTDFSKTTCGAFRHSHSIHYIAWCCGKNNKRDLNVLLTPPFLSFYERVAQFSAFCTLYIKPMVDLACRMQIRVNTSVNRNRGKPRVWKKWTCFTKQQPGRTRPKIVVT